MSRHCTTAALLLLVCGTGCSRQKPERFTPEQLSTSRDVEFANQLLGSAEAPSRLIVAAPTVAGDDPDLWATITIDSGAGQVSKELALYYLPEAPRLATPEGVLSVHGGSSGMMREGVDQNGDPFAERFQLNLERVYQAGALCFLEYHFTSESANVNLTRYFPVLWDVPIQTFYWPEGIVRVEIRSSMPPRSPASPDEADARRQNLQEGL